MQKYTDSTTFDITWGWRGIIAVIFLVGSGIATIMITLRLTMIVTGLQIEKGLTSPILYLASASIPGLMLLGTYLFAARQSGWVALGIRQPPWQAIAITPFLLLIELFGMVFINNIIAYIRGETFSNPQVEILSGGKAIGPYNLILLLFLIAILAPIAEELFFRGMLYGFLRQQWGSRIAIVLSAAIFAVFHFIPLLIPALFFIGLILAILRQWSNSVIPCIMLHMMQNGIVVILISVWLS